MALASSKLLRETLAKFFADRGTHLAAMIAYFALLSLVPLVFLALALLGFAERQDEQSYVVTELNRMFPDQSVVDILAVVNGIQQNAKALGIVGGIFLAWSSLSLFSVLESAFNVVYGRPNRSFLRGKALALVLAVGSLIFLFLALFVGSFGYEVLKRFAPGVIANDYVAYTLSVLISMLGLFVFLASVYYLLTNERMTFDEVLPGAVAATVVLQATFQILPIYLRVSGNVLSVRAFAGPALLLIWLYLMSNVIVFGAEVNWWRTRRRRELAVDEIPGLA